MTPGSGAVQDLIPRPPRLRRIAPPLTIRVPDPPAPPAKAPHRPLWRALLIGLLPATLPPLGLAIATLALGQQSQMVVMSAVLVCTLGLGMLMTTLLSRRDQDARDRMAEADFAHRRASYESTMENIERDCAEHASVERAYLERSHAAPVDLVRRATTDRSGLWERLPGDDDFLQLRLGVGSVRSGISFGEESISDDLAVGLRDRYQRLESVPVAVDLRSNQLTGLCGDPKSTAILLNSILLQAAANHAPNDLRIAVFTQDEDVVHWAKWMPHTAIAGAGTDRLVARSGRGLGIALQALNEISDGAGTVPAYLLVADVRSWPDLTSRLDSWLRRQGGPVLVVGATLADLPKDCDSVIEVGPDSGTMRRRVDPEPPVVFDADRVSAKEALRLALALAPAQELDSIARQPIPRSVRTVELLGMSALSWDGIASAWSASRKSFRLRAPIGLMAGGEPLEIDLRRDGPHGLIAGTTGSGKSEFLQTLIVSMAARIPPDLLNFLLIDYKGGSAFEQIKTLPHVVGMVTDLDERLATRALTSLRAELHRREKLFASTKPAVENIAEYQKTARAVPLANVVIIIDEFHRLVSEQPDFIDQIVRIAQQGRSLGVHLLLATQKPSGVVNDHIRANTPLRICLRVTDDADSRDVLGVVDAARIPKELPGRVYVKVGSEEPIAAQTARTSGEIELPSQTGSVSVNWFIRPLRRGVKSGEVVVWPVTATPRSTDSTTIVEHADGRTALVQSICRAATERPIPKQLAPWALPLPESLALASLETAAAAAGPVIGLLDEPELQRQRPLELDLGAGHVLVAGGANTGKTTALLTMAQALAAVKGPAQLHVYGIDFGGGGLGPLMQLAHCGGVARQYDNPSLGWLLGALGEIVAARSAQGPARAGDWPQVLVVVDNFIGLSTSLESWEDPGAPNDLLEIMEVGRSVGVSFVLSAERPEAIRAGVMATLGTRLVLPLADSTGYGALGMWHAHSSGEPIAGRAILADGVGHEVQIALPGPWEGLVGSAVADGPLRISPLPTVVAVSDVAARVDPSEKNLVLGLKDGTDSLFRYSAEEHLLVLGPRGAGRSNALLVALAEARRIGATAWVWNTRRSVCLARFSPQGIPDKQVQYAEPQTGQTAWAELKAEVATRMAALEKGGGSAFKPMLVVIDDADAVDLPTPEAEMMGSLVLGGPDLRITLAVAMSTQALRTKAPYDWRRTLLSLKRGILLSPQAVQDYEHFDVRGRPQRMPKGRGFVCSDGTKHLVQIALADS